MNKTQLIHIFRTFSKKEIRDFRKWLLSPAHNQREDVLLLYDYLSENNRWNEEALVQKEVVYPYVFGNIPFDDSKMRQVIHFLLKRTEDFLIYNEVMEDKVSAQISLTKIYRRRQLGKYFDKVVSNTTKIQKSQALRNQTFHKNAYRLNYEVYNFESSQKRGQSLNLQELSNSLDRYYLADKLLHCCAMISHQSVYKVDYDFGLFELIEKEIESRNYLQYPAIALYYYSFKSLTDPSDESHFQKMKAGLFKDAALFPNLEVLGFLVLAINYCIKNINQGKSAYFEEVFHLYQEGFERRYFIENGVVSAATFRNAVSTALQLKQFDWVESLIQEYQHYLPQKDREATVLFCQARLNFDQGNYKDAMVMMSQTEVKDVLLNLRIKSMLMKIYYEEESFEALESLISSLKKYIIRKKVLGYYRENFKNLLTLTQKLSQLNHYDKAAKANFLELIEATNPLISTDRQWLVDMTNKS